MRRTRLFFLLIAVVVAAGIGYTGFWYHAEGLVREGLASWVAARRAEGFRIDFRAVTTSGYPFAVRLRIEQPVAEAPAKEWMWTGDAVEADARPWAFRHIDVYPFGRQEVSLPNGDGRESVVATATDAVARVDFLLNGRFDRASLDAENLTFSVPSAPGPITARLAYLALRASQADLRSNPPDENTKGLPVSADLSLSLQDITLPKAVAGPLGSQLSWITAEAQLLGPWSAGKPAVSLAAWRDAGGVLELKNFDISWGPLGLSGNATVALDGNMQPMGAGTGRVRGYQETIDALVAQGLMKQREGLLAKAGLGLLAKTPPEGGPKVLTVPLTIQEQVLYAGPVGILRIPTIAWAK